MTKRDRRTVPDRASFNDFRAGLVELDGEQYLVVSYPAPARSDLSVLTPAERSVLELLRRGLSNADIASRRGTSQNTVANQVAAILRKLEFRSRYGLSADLGCPSTEGRSYRTSHK
jgi:DNA-binding NarL/FixJ family response regulator